MTRIHQILCLACLASSLLVTSCAAESFVPDNGPAFYSAPRGGSTLEDEAIGTNSNSKSIQQIRVTPKTKRTGVARMPPKYNNGNGQSKQRKKFNPENISDAAYSTLTEVEDRPIHAEFIADTALPTDIGQFRLRAYRTPESANGNEYTGREPSVIYPADPSLSPFGADGNFKRGAHVRVHDQCLTSEVFRSQR